MRLRIAACLFLYVAVVGVACNQTQDSPCETFGGECLTVAAQCGESLPYACSTGSCCIPNGLPAPGVPSATASASSPPGADAAPAPDAGPDATMSNPPDATIAVDSGAGEDTNVAEDTNVPEAPDTGAPEDTNVPETEDSGIADSGAPDVAVSETGPVDAGASDASDASGG